MKRSRRTLGLKRRALEKLVAAMLAADPELFRQVTTERRLDRGRMNSVLNRLHLRQPDLHWALVDAADGAAYVYEDLLAAAEDYQHGIHALTACKVEAGKLSLRMDDQWVEVEAYRADAVAPDGQQPSE